MKKMMMVTLVSLLGFGFVTLAANSDLGSSVLQMGTCYTPKHTIKFYPRYNLGNGVDGIAQLLAPDYQGPDATDNVDDPNSYLNARPGTSVMVNGQEVGVWTTWKVSRGQVYLRWLNPSYWAPLAINFRSSVCRFAN